MLLEKSRQEILRQRPIKLKEIIESTKAGPNPNSYDSTFHIHCSQQKNLQVVSQVKNHDVGMDEPPSLGGDGTAPNPVEILLSAFAGCMEINWIMYSSLHHLDLKRVEVEIHATIDKRFVFGSQYGVPARLSSITIISHLFTNEPRDKVDRVFKKVHEICPVGGSLHPEIQKKYELVFHPVD